MEIVDDDQKVSGTIIRVTPKEYGEFVLSLAWSGSHITGSPFRVAVCDPSRCEVSGDIADRKAYLVGRPILFNVATREAWINDEIQPVVTAVGPSAKHVADVKKLEDYRYQVMFTPYEVGPHQVSVKFGEGHLPNVSYWYSNADCIDSEWLCPSLLPQPDWTRTRLNSCATVHIIYCTECVRRHVVCQRWSCSVPVALSVLLHCCTEPLQRQHHDSRRVGGVYCHWTRTAACLYWYPGNLPDLSFSSRPGRGRSCQDLCYWSGE